MVRLASLTAVLWSAASVAHAATIPVTTGADGVADDGQCTLREAISSANSDAVVGGCAPGGGADEITIPALTVTLSVAGPGENANASGDLDVLGDVTLRGAGAGTTIVDAAGIDRVLDVGPVNATVAQLTIRGGHAPDGADGTNVAEVEDFDATGTDGGHGVDGGGVLNAGTLTIADSVVTGNRAGDGGDGGLGAGGNCNVPGPNPCNGGSSGGDGFGGFGGLGGFGGGVSNTGTLTILRSLITGNAAGQGGAGGAGQGGEGDDVTAVGVTGGAGGDGRGRSGGQGGRAGGVYSDGGPQTISASTIADNRTGAGGHGGNGVAGAGGDGTGNPSNGGASGDASGGSGAEGGIGGGIMAVDAATIEDSAITGNTAGASGDGGDATGATAGNGTGTGQGGLGMSTTAGEGVPGTFAGGVYGGQLTARRVLISNNVAGDGGAGGSATGGTDGSPAPPGGSPRGGAGGPGGSGGIGGGLVVRGTLTDATVHANLAGDGGRGGAGKPGLQGGNGDGGAGGSGGGFLSVGSTGVKVERATIGANAIGSPGAGGTAAGLTGGEAGAPGQGPALFGGPGFTLSGSIVTESGTEACAGAVVDGGGNIRFPAGTCPGTAADPQLGALLDNGGPTATRALAPTSPAIDRAACSATDQRGVARPAGVSCDAGAYEFAPPAVGAGSSSDIDATSATLRADVTSNARRTTVRFEYGPTTAYGSTTADQTVAAATTAVTASARVAGLLPFTTYHFRAVAVNADGTTAGPDVTFTSTALAPGEPEVTTATASALKLAPGAFQAEAKGPSASAKRKKGTTVTFRLDRDASVVFTVQKAAAGRRVVRGGKATCAKPTRSNRKRKRCTRYVSVKGSFTVAGKAAGNRFHFSGRLRNRRLRVARYRLVATPSSAGRKGKPATRAFRIVR